MTTRHDMYVLGLEEGVALAHAGADAAEARQVAGSYADHPDAAAWAEGVEDGYTDELETIRLAKEES